LASVVPIDPWKGAKEKKMKSGTISHYACLACANSKATGSRLSSSSSAAVPLLKDPKKIAKMLKKLQKVMPLISSIFSVMHHFFSIFTMF
jgi:hypothetical protein